MTDQNLAKFTITADDGEELLTIQDGKLWFKTDAPHHVAEAVFDTFRDKFEAVFGMQLAVIKANASILEEFTTGIVNSYTTMQSKIERLREIVAEEHDRFVTEAVQEAVDQENVQA